MKIILIMGAVLFALYAFNTLVDDRKFNSEREKKRQWMDGQ